MNGKVVRNFPEHDIRLKAIFTLLLSILDPFIWYEKRYKEKGEQSHLSDQFPIEPDHIAWCIMRNMDI